MRGKFAGVCILAVGFAVELAIMGEADKFLETNGGYTVSISIQGEKDETKSRDVIKLYGTKGIKQQINVSFACLQLEFSNRGSQKRPIVQVKLRANLMPVKITVLNCHTKR